MLRKISAKPTSLGEGCADVGVKLRSMSPAVTDGARATLGMEGCTTVSCVRELARLYGLALTRVMAMMGPPTARGVDGG